MLSEKDKEALAVLQRYERENGYLPTVRELAGLLGVVSTNTVHYRIARLVEAGVARKRPVGRCKLIWVQPAEVRDVEMA